MRVNQKKSNFLIMAITIMAITMILAPFTKAASKQNTSKSAVSTNGKKIELTYWAILARKDWTEAALKIFEKNNPNIKINIVYNSGDNQKQNIIVAASSHTLPDIWYNYSGPGSNFFMENKLCYDLTPLAKKENWFKTMRKSALDSFTYKGKINAYPLAINTTQVIYRKDIFEKYGIKVPTTWAEFETALATLKKNQITPFCIAGKNGWLLNRLMDELFEMYTGPKVHDKLFNLQTSWDTPAVVEVYSKFKEWVNKGYFLDGFMSQDPNDIRMMMYSGVTAMTIDGSTLIQKMLVTDKQDTRLYGTFNIPTNVNKGGTRVPIYPNGNQFNANITAEKLAAAIKFTDTLVSDNAAFDGIRTYPSPLVSSVIPSSIPMVSDITESGDKYGTFVVSDQTMDPGFINTYYLSLQNIVSGKMTPEEAASFMEKSAKQYKKSLK